MSNTSRPLSLRVAAFTVIAASLMTSACATHEGNSVLTVSRRQLGSALLNHVAAKSLMGRELIVEGTVHAYAPESAFLQLTENLPGGGEESNADRSCVDLALRKELFGELQDHQSARLRGRLFVMDTLAGLAVTSMKQEGVTFHPRCRYFEPMYAFFLVDEVMQH